MLKKILIANRGEIACRILRSVQAKGLGSVAVYSEADRDAPHVALADEAYCIGAAPVHESYLRQEAILEVAKKTSADAVHPGYGLLSENADFAEACEKAGLVFLGPTPEQMRSFGLKHEARRLAEATKVPLLPGSGLLKDVADATKQATQIGYPVMLKSTAGGGGIGMSICRDEGELIESYERVERLGKSHFGQAGIFLEKFVEFARHLEVQVFGDGKGRVVSLGVRDCSTQRRNQKVIEETPPANVSDEVLYALQTAALRLCRSVNYRSAGTVEFVYDDRACAFYFLEVNTRLQVEHGVTEMVTGIDLVGSMIDLGAGTLKLPEVDIAPQCGHAIQVRVYAEDPQKNFQPSSGLLTQVTLPEEVRVDHWIEAGLEISPHYDPLLAKVQASGTDRQEALAHLQRALEVMRIDGIEVNLDYLRAIVASEAFQKGSMLTRTLGEFEHQPSTVEVLRGGTMTTVQDFPGRQGYWSVGVPPSGPMDDLAFRLGNRLLGNDETAAGLEITASGPKLRFHTETTVMLSGAPVKATLNGKPIGIYEPVQISAGDELDIGQTTENGIRAYLCLAGGLDVPAYLGSRSTFTLGQFGGHGGRALRVGDVLHLFAPPRTPRGKLPPERRPVMSSTWEVAVLYGPHGAPDFFTKADIETFFETYWEVHYNSARTGVRLIGPKPQWAREDGGEAGLHPSNIHDNAYAVGAIDFTGDMPVILGPDGPSLGGFVCPATVIESERWKLGQLKPGDKVRFRCVSPGQAATLRDAQSRYLETFNPPVALSETAPSNLPKPESAILLDQGQGEQRLVVRQAGDAYVLAEVGSMKLDFELRFHIHLLYQALAADKHPGIIDLTPGIRSLQVHFDPARLSAGEVTDWIARHNAQQPPLEEASVPARVVHLPLSWDDPATREAIDKYMQSVRPDAPWCPDNIEFIRRINGLDTRQDVYDIVFGARYVVLGLGDVYLGAPVATPLDPRHRLVTTKYNPARTWTPENAVGIGGAYLCVYGMEGPGGYQFVGRTVQMWNRYHQTSVFTKDKPWLLRFFDQIKFYPVSTEELQEMRRDFLHGRFTPKIEEAHFSLKEHQAFLDKNRDSIEAFKQRQQQAFEAERERWRQAGLAEHVEEIEAAPAENIDVPAGAAVVESPVAGSVWKILARDGAQVAQDETLAIIESMKMEIKVNAPAAGTCRTYAKEGAGVAPGQVLFAIE